MQNLFRSSTLSAGLIAAGLVSVLPAAASAAIVTIDFSQQNVGITAGQFEYGFYVDAEFLQDDYNTGSTTRPAGAPFNFSGEWIEYSSSFPGSRTVYFVDPSSPTSVVAILSFTVQNYTTATSLLSGTFSAGALGALPGGLDAGNVFVADGSTFNFAYPYLVGQVITPTPGAAAVLGLGGLASMRRRRR